MESFDLAWAALMMARIRPFGTSCGIESACLSYVTVCAVSISKRCTVNIYSNKISNLSCYVRAGVVVTMGAWARGFGAWRCRSFVPSTLARHPCQAPVPDTSTQYDAHSARAIGVRKQPSVLRRPTFSPALKLPVISCRELERATRPLPRSPPLYPQHQIFLSFSFSGLSFFFLLSFHPLFPRNLR
jgi:hypothetical protein